MTTFFTADTHFGHARIIELCKRPFASVEEMNETMVRRWNERVKPEDTVYHLGDFTLGGLLVGEPFLLRLTGRKILIVGNHDLNAVVRSPLWESTAPYLEIREGGRNVVLCHYAMRVWNRSHHGSRMLHGHSHGMLPGIRHSLDVGVDAWDFRPVTFAEIETRMAVQSLYRDEEPS